ncbi:hypothetical protein E5K00_19105 [Hymenobacter aquaticus]|uniref:Glycerophosphoryl diester phosphodiesterase membrane domain-containing protein n=1 Tax=Hymenobacter aquaticus TaxID=1867101 RepID=A0A4Z0Q0R9_9BACT|nr:hypothetical protein [Hymenobacter aquaticus]TGE22352.1 hypothetical protein E5K00_19105 [Hymenobacter aquaticus]
MNQLTYTRASDFLRERDFGRKIEASFEFVRAHFRPLGRCLLYIVLPIMLIQGIASGLLQSRLGGVLQVWSNLLKSGGRGQLESMQLASDLIKGPEYWVTIAASLCSFTLLILTVYGYVVLRLEKADPAESVTVPEVWAVVRQRFVGALLSFFGLAFLLFAVVIALALAGSLLVVLITKNPGLIVLLILAMYGAMGYAAVVLSLFFIVQIRERTGFFATIGRCFSLVWGKWWSTFGLILVMSLLIMMLVVVVFGLTSLISNPFAGATARPDAGSLGAVLPIVASCLNSVAVLALYPLLFLALAFQYFNLVERKEGQGLYSLVDAIGAQPQPAPRRYQPDDEGEY